MLEGILNSLDFSILKYVLDALKENKQMSEKLMLIGVQMS